jgi:glycosyltransferase involved in cell wall biosynthesis
MLFKLLKGRQQDAIISSFDAVNLAVVVGALAGVRRRIVWYRTLTAQIEQDWPDSKLKLRWLQWRKKQVYRLATHLATVSEHARNELWAVYRVRRQKCHIIHTCRPDPMDILGEKPPRHAPAAKVICVARMHPSKGIDVLLKAVRFALDQRPDLKLLVELVGDGPCRGEYEALTDQLGLRGVVSFAGKLDFRQVLERTAQAHIAAIPFRTDAGPGVVSEALGCGVPIIASSGGALRELLNDTKAAILVPPADPHAFGRALLRVLASEEEVEAMSRAARELFMARFHLSHWTNSVIAWLEELTDAKQKPKEL